MAPCFWDFDKAGGEWQLPVWGKARRIRPQAGFARLAVLSQGENPMPTRCIDEPLHEADRHIVAGDFDQARNALHRARTCVQNQGPTDQEVVVLARLGELELTCGAYPAARDILTEALGLCTDDIQVSDRAYVLHLLGDLEDAEGHGDQRDSYWEAAKRLRQDVGDAGGEARILRAQARVARRAHHEEKALDLYARALHIYTSLGWGFHRGMVLREVGRLQKVFGRADLAHEAFDTAIDLFSMNGDLLDEALTRYDLGDLLGGIGDVDGAREALGAAVKSFTSAGDLPGQARTLLKLGHLNRSEAPRVAHKQFLQSADLAERSGLVDLQIAALRQVDELAL